MTTIQQAQAMLAKLSAERFFGTVSFQFKGGTVVLVRKEETILPGEINGRTDNERQR